MVKQEDTFLVEIKRDKHILSGYNVAYRLRLNFTDTSITQTLGSFDDRLLNDSPTCSHLLLVQCKVHGEASQSFLDDLTPFCNLIGRGEICRAEPKLKTRFTRGWCKTWTLDSGLDYGLRFGLNFGLTRSILTTISNQPYLLGSTERRAVNLSLLLEHRVGEVSGVTEMENNRLTSL